MPGLQACFDRPLRMAALAAEHLNKVHWSCCSICQLIEQQLRPSPAAACTCMHWRTVALAELCCALESQLHKTQ